MYLSLLMIEHNIHKKCNQTEICQPLKSSIEHSKTKFLHDIVKVSDCQLASNISANFHIFMRIEVLKLLQYAPLRSTIVHITVFRGELMASSMWVFKHNIHRLYWGGRRRPHLHHEVFGVHNQHNVKCFPLRLSAKKICGSRFHLVFGSKFHHNWCIHHWQIRLLHAVSLQWAVVAAHYFSMKCLGDVVVVEEQQENEGWLQRWRMRV